MMEITYFFFGVGVGVLLMLVLGTAIERRAK